MRPISSSTARSICSATTTRPTPTPADMERREADALARLGIANPYSVVA